MARFVDHTNYHLTIAFLGNIAHGQIEPIASAIDTVGAGHTPFDLTFDRIGAFPNERRPRVVYVGSRGSSPKYRALADDVRATVTALGFALEENDAIPHVTIARIARSNRQPLPMLDIRSFDMSVGELTLFESVPFEGTTRYIIRHRSKFGNGDAERRAVPKPNVVSGASRN